MWDKLKNDGFAKKMLRKVIVIILIIIIALLTFDVLANSKDGRRQVVDPNGGTEYIETEAEKAATKEELRLTSILEDMSRVGDVQVMITYQGSAADVQAAEASVFDSPSQKNNYIKVEGVVITAEGAANVVVKNNIISAVAALYGIPSTRIMVYEKEGGKIQ